MLIEDSIRHEESSALTPLLASAPPRYMGAELALVLPRLHLLHGLNLHNIRRLPPRLGDDAFQD